MRCTFFCSEEHAAAAYRRRVRLPDGVYPTFEQAAWADRIAQTALFPRFD